VGVAKLNGRYCSNMKLATHGYEIINGLYLFRDHNLKLMFLTVYMISYYLNFLKGILILTSHTSLRNVRAPFSVLLGSLYAVITPYF